MTTPPPLPLHPDIKQSYLPTHDLTYHTLSAGSPSNPLILLIHGFPELAFSWRKIMVPLAAEGYHVVAFDQRGYGFTTGWDTRSFDEVDMKTFSFIRLVRDVVVLVNALGHKEVECVIGHDFGGLTAGTCSLIRPDVFKSVVIMSHPFKGAPPLPSAPNSTSAPGGKKEDVHQALASLDPPRKHYKWYYSTLPAASEMLNPKEDLHTFLRGYFHLKSATWTPNNPHPLSSWSAPELSQLPSYYTMPLHASMREAVSLSMAGEDPIASTSWLSEQDLAVYTETWAKTGFQGALNWYRVATNPASLAELEVFAGRTVGIPALYVAGEKDWGSYQEPGALEGMGNVYTDFRGVVMVKGAGHWVQQEQPEKVVEVLLKFLGDVKRGRVSF
ncbi:hypothetical protein HYFRA_00002149 [Hymenoscyphus fraxineus]|uniref:AB hydrolase-1 domain-containing protein n=1 Tax=Hymenoscyphus fraxineus TaxID=746836 RepID=A0A9N9KLB0_9HELO|nr:hypothetical protein HYFRA_00002149 [Hymenoscyphus fraxineus]